MAGSALTASEQQVAQVITTSEHAMENIWHYPIVKVDNNSVTIGNILIAMLALLIGIWYLNKLKLKLKLFLHKRFAEDKDAANAIENLITYAVLIMFVTVVMQIANIPLSTFAFVGGALAIGVGLGAQNLINNFISSFIIMMERSIKMGDTIQIGDIRGKVVSIGARCVTIQTNKMTDVLVPNSKLIEENLVNWSLIDNYARAFVDIKFYKNEYCKLGKELEGVTVPAEELDNSLRKISGVNNNPEFICNKLQEIFSSFPEMMEAEEPIIYFSTVDNWYYTFQVVFTYDTKKVSDLFRLKANINLALANNFDVENLVIEYIN